MYKRCVGDALLKKFVERLVFWGVDGEWCLSGLKEFTWKVSKIVVNEVENIEFSYVVMLWINSWINLKCSFSWLNWFVD